jgi:hypothetical protein
MFRTLKIITSGLVFVTQLQSVHVIFVGVRPLLWGWSSFRDFKKLRKGLATTPTLRNNHLIICMWIDRLKEEKMIYSDNQKTIDKKNDIQAILKCI